MDEMKDNLLNFKQKPERQKQPDRQQMKVDISQFPNVKCIHCGCEVFDETHVVKIIPSVISPSGRQEVAPVPTLVCHKCSAPLKDALAAMAQPNPVPEK